jgi:hypothetical protein
LNSALYALHLTEIVKVQTPLSGSTEDNFLFEYCAPNSAKAELNGTTKTHLALKK